MKGICTFIETASWVFLTKKQSWTDQGKMDSDSTHQKPPHWACFSSKWRSEVVPQAISWLVGEGLGRSQRGCGQALWGWSVFALVERDSSRVSCPLWKPFGPSVCVPTLLKGPVGADERGTAAGLVARLLCPSLTLMAKQPWAHSPSSAQDTILPPPLPGVSLTFSTHFLSPLAFCGLQQFDYVS